MRRLILVALLAQCTAHAASTNQSLSPYGEGIEIEVLKQLFPEIAIEHGNDISTCEYAREAYTRTRQKIIKTIENPNNRMNLYPGSPLLETLSIDTRRAVRLRKRYELVNSKCELNENGCCLQTPTCCMCTTISAAIACICTPVWHMALASCAGQATSTLNPVPDVMYTSLVVAPCFFTYPLWFSTVYNRCCMPCVLPEIEQPSQQVMHLPERPQDHSLLDRTSDEEISEETSLL